MIDNWIICLIHCWKLWFCEHLQKQTKERSYCTLWCLKLWKSKIVMKIDSIRWVFQFAIFINQEAWILLITWKTRLKSAVLMLTALISLFIRKNKLGRWDKILFNLCSITNLYKLLHLKYNYNHYLQNKSRLKWFVISEVSKVNILKNKKNILFP